METISSILAQTFLDFEVIVGNDDTSEPLSLEILGLDDPRIRIVNHSVNLGEIANMNELLALSRGRYFTWIADDDLYRQDFLQAIHDAHEQLGPVSCVFCGYESGAVFEQREDVSYTQEIRKMSGAQFLRDYLSRKIETLGCMGVFDRQYLREAGGMIRLGGGFSPYSDNLLAIRAGLQTSLCYIDAPLIFFRTHSGSISYSSTAIDDYLSAQNDLCKHAMEIFSAAELQKDMQRNLYQLLGHWCLTFSFAVLDRSQNLRAGYIRDYIRFQRKYATNLETAYRIRLVALALRLSVRHWIVAPMLMIASRAGLRRFRFG